MADEITFDEEQQKLVDKLVGEARVKAREKAESELEEKAKAAKVQAAKETLAAEGKWKELVESHEARIAELEPFEAKVAAYEELISGMLKERVLAMGEAAKKAIGALPASMSTLEKLVWLQQNAELFQGAGGDGVGSPTRPPARPKQKKIEGPISKFPIRL